MYLSSCNRATISIKYCISVNLTPGLNDLHEVQIHVTKFKVRSISLWVNVGFLLLIQN